MGLSTFSKILDVASSQTISAACSSHTGKRRKNNEDNFFFGGQYMSCRNQGLGSILQKGFSLKKTDSLVYSMAWEVANMEKLPPI